MKANAAGISTSQRDFPEWAKQAHLDHMRDSGHFRFTREVLLHSIEQGDAARFLELILSNARSHQFQMKTITEQEIGFDYLARAAYQTLGSKSLPWYLSYRVCIGIK